MLCDVVRQLVQELRQAVQRLEGEKDQQWRPRFFAGSTGQAMQRGLRKLLNDKLLCRSNSRSWLTSSVSHLLQEEIVHLRTRFGGLQQEPSNFMVCQVDGGYGGCRIDG